MCIITKEKALCAILKLFEGLNHGQDQDRPEYFCIYFSAKVKGVHSHVFVFYLSWLLYNSLVLPVLLWNLFSMYTKDFAASIYLNVNFADYNYYFKGINKDKHLLINKLAFQSVIYDVKFGLTIESRTRRNCQHFPETRMHSSRCVPPLDISTGWPYPHSWKEHGTRQEVTTYKPPHQWTE